ncbi:DUF3732 domain-containing protein (plasmid) [Streptomyces sp. NBC_00464]|uniref:DUF3732 domain-containing protein n=1 Tax=Streptomyces sp. NBC_00464 TaxID=2975751 RepID=UPI002E16F2C0
MAAQLALHQYFTANSRPVPRFLMLDQPTQPYYPSDMAKARGRLENLALDEDRVTVTGLFQLMHQIATEPSPTSRSTSANTPTCHTPGTRHPSATTGATAKNSPPPPSSTPTPPHSPRHHIPGTTPDGT